MKSRLHQLTARGQSVWIDFLSRDLIESGALARAVSDDAVVGVTSNPTSSRRRCRAAAPTTEQIATSGDAEAKNVFLALAMRDVAAACDVLRPTWERSRGGDGYVSIEVDPNLADDADATINEATLLHEAIARPNLLVKVPATDAGVVAIEEMTDQLGGAAGRARRSRPRRACESGGSKIGVKSAAMGGTLRRQRFTKLPANHR